MRVISNRDHNTTTRLPNQRSMRIAQDKWKHFWVGVVMGLLFQAVGMYLLPMHLYVATAISFIIVVAISYGFELYSKYTGHGHYEVLDAVAAIIGGVLGMGVVVMLEMVLA
jgi:VanZ family protein